MYKQSLYNVHKHHLDTKEVRKKNRLKKYKNKKEK